MFGIVLWCDRHDQKAVIWCEDHGELAFYHRTGDCQNFDMDAGDWVQFDVTLNAHLRMAHNPRLVSEGVCPDIARTLETRAQPAASAPRSRSSAKIIPFSAHATREAVKARAGVKALNTA